MRNALVFLLLSSFTLSALAVRPSQMRRRIASITHPKPPKAPQKQDLPTP